jgi:hypothetical protein
MVIGATFGGEEGALEAYWIHRTIPLGSFFSMVLVAATAQEQPAVPKSPMTRAEREAFLLNATIVGEATLAPGTRRVSLVDGQREHDASVEASSSRDPLQRDYKSNVAAYEVDKLLELNLVSPSVERTVNGRPATLTWWVDDVLMDELSRRRQNIEPPDLERWTQQMQAVRVFDELIANAYRSMSPASYLSTVWDNLLITREWRIWLIDHTRAFGTSRRLQHPESLTQCSRAVLTRLRVPNHEALERQLGRLLSSEQVDALEARRALIVKHFDELIARRGEGAVLYHLPSRR